MHQPGHIKGRSHAEAAKVNGVETHIIRNFEVLLNGGWMDARNETTLLPGNAVI